MTMNRWILQCWAKLEESSTIIWTQRNWLRNVQLCIAIDLKTVMPLDVVL